MTSINFHNSFQDYPSSIYKRMERHKKISDVNRYKNSLPSPLTIKQSLSQNHDIDESLFDILSDDGKTIAINKFWAAVEVMGILSTDERLADIDENFEKERKAQRLSSDADVKLEKSVFLESICDNICMVGKIFKNEFVIGDFESFTQMLKKLFDECALNTGGQPSNYIPQLQRANPFHWGLAVCTIDGQRRSFGDSNVPFTLQSICKALNYAIAVTHEDPDYVHQYVGQEPSGRGSSDLSLDQNNRPHNPMINAGGIITASLLYSDEAPADRFDQVTRLYRKAAGGEFIGFNNPAYLSACSASDRDFALAYFMRENKCYPEDTQDLKKNLELYFQLCSTEVTVESGSVIAATLANGGICPLTGYRAFSGEAVRDTLSLMYACGMYDFSGEFAFMVGLPTKSGRSGAMLLIIPNVMGICLWSPPVDEMENCVRGVDFCKRLVKQFNFHNYDNLKHAEKKEDPRNQQLDSIGDDYVTALLFGAASGDEKIIRRYMLSQADMGRADYDGRTALHLAASEGHLHIVKMLLEKCHVNPSPKDRYNFTPLEDAKRYEQLEIVKYLGDFLEKNNNGI